MYPRRERGAAVRITNAMHVETGPRVAEQVVQRVLSSVDLGTPCITSLSISCQFSCWPPRDFCAHTVQTATRRSLFTTAGRSLFTIAGCNADLPASPSTSDIWTLRRTSPWDEQSSRDWRSTANQHTISSSRPLPIGANSCRKRSVRTGLQQTAWIGTAACG